MARIGLATAAATAVIWVSIALLRGPGGPGVSIAAVLDPVARATGEVGAAHIVLRVLAREGEDFSFVNLEGDPQEVEAWIQWPGPAGDPGRALINKGDRIYWFDGKETIAYHPQRREALRGEGRGVDLELFWPAAWVRRIQGAPAEDMEVIDHEEARGKGRLALRERGLPTSGRAPAFLAEFDRETEVEWDLGTRRLTGLRRWIHHGGERRLFSELVAVEYLPAVDDATFAFDLPADIRWIALKDAPADLAALGPREVARRFLQAAVDGDRAALELYCPSPYMVDQVLGLGISDLVSLGEPFRTGAYPGVYVPYKVRIGKGWVNRLKDHNLALRNDNPQRRWIFDGGI
jgi:hypothetical protein